MMHSDIPEYFFITQVNLECPKEQINDLVNFLPVFWHHSIFNEEDLIDKFMYDYMVANKIHASSQETKLACLLDTYGQFILGLVIIDIRTVLTY